jgi:hypothetical protein
MHNDLSILSVHGSGNRYAAAYCFAVEAKIQGGTTNMFNKVEPTIQT